MTGESDRSFELPYRRQSRDWAIFAHSSRFPPLLSSDETDISFLGRIAVAQMLGEPQYDLAVGTGKHSGVDVHVLHRCQRIPYSLSVVYVVSDDDLPR